MYWNEVSKVESVKQKDKNLSFPQNRFAVLEMKIALAKILTNFEFTLDRVIGDQFHLTVKSHIIFSSRK